MTLWRVWHCAQMIQCGASFGTSPSHRHRHVGAALQLRGGYWAFASHYSAGTKQQMDNSGWHGLHGQSGGRHGCYCQDCDSGKYTGWQPMARGDRHARSGVSARAFFIHAEQTADVLQELIRSPSSRTLFEFVNDASPTWQVLSR